MFLIEGIFPSIDKPLNETNVEEEEEEEEEIPEISFHAISGNAAPQTMRFFGKIEDSVVTILVDSGSTHNFLNSKLATKMGIYPTKKGEFSVEVADGNKMKSEGLCKNLLISV